MEEKITFCQSGGCTAKLGAGILNHILEKLPKGEKDANLLVGYDSRDDAAVYQVSDDTAIVQTLDFFPPVVEDPYTFGKIAATNALSDIYAMGGEEYFENGICLIEWGEIIKDALPSNYIKITFSKNDDNDDYRELNIERISR